MKIVKPNKQGSKLPFINNTLNDKGITLISLIVMVILLIILSVVSIRAITGEEGVIKVSSDATEDYNILQYKEQIEQLRESIILKYEMAGDNLSLERLAKEMEQETTWLKRAIANTDKDVSNEDIVVATTDGYIFQLYYDINYGQKFIEYLGREDGNNIPTVVARYSKETNKIAVTAKEEGSGIGKIEIIHKGEIVKAGEGSTLEHEPVKTGWYVIKVTTNAGKLRYGWIRVSSTIATPEIKILGSGEQENGWYGKDSKPVVVKITGKGDRVKEIHYTTNRWETEEVVQAKEVTLERNNKIRNNKYLCIYSRREWK